MLERLKPRLPRRALRQLAARGWERVLAVGLLAVLFSVRVADPAWLEVLRHRTFDAYQIVKPRIVGNSPVIIVDIDDRSLSELGQWPWPRTLLADIVHRLADAGAAAIALDALLSEPDRLSPPLLARSIADLDPATQDRLALLPSNELVLARAMRRTRVVLAQAGQLRATQDNPDRPTPRTGVSTVGGDPRPFLLDYPGLLRNQPELEAAATGRGLTTFRPDRDGVIRRAPAVMIAEGRLAPALAIEVLRVATGASSVLVRRDRAGVHSIVLGGREIPTDSNGQLWLHHARHTPARFVSAADVLAGRADPARVRGKLALVGSSAVGLFDLRTTPLERVMPGVELHAQIVENIIAGSLLTRPHHAIGVELTVAALTGLGVIVLVPMLGATAVMLLGAATAAALIGGSWYLFDQHRQLIDVVYPLLSSLAVFLVLTFANYLKEETRRVTIRSAFSRYLSPTLVEQLVREPARLVLGGETREMTILFSDVRGFTAISETFKGDPQGLTVFMNRLLTPLTNAILEERGTVDKYMGDAILAFWNAPLDDELHATHACRAALEMLKRRDQLNAQRRAEAEAAQRPFVPIDLGIGLNTGTCVVGNMGSDLRFDYSVLGDPVNVASRIEGLTKLYGVSVLLGSETARLGASDLAILPVDVIRVMGKSEPEPIFALVGDGAMARSPQFLAFASGFAAMRAAYSMRDWELAQAHLAQCREHDCTAVFSRLLGLFDERIRLFKTREPPPENWDGVVAMSSKA